MKDRNVVEEYVEKFSADEKEYAKEYHAFLVKQGLPYSYEEDGKDVFVFVDDDHKDSATGLPICIGCDYYLAADRTDEPEKVRVKDIIADDLWETGDDLLVVYEDEEGKEYRYSINRFASMYSADPERKKKQLKWQHFYKNVLPDCYPALLLISLVGLLLCLFGLQAIIDPPSKRELVVKTGSFECTVLDRRLSENIKARTGYIFTLKDEDGEEKLFYVPENIYNNFSVKDKVTLEYTSTRDDRYMFGGETKVVWTIDEQEIYELNTTFYTNGEKG